MRRLGEIVAVSVAVSGAALLFRGRLVASLACGSVLIALVAIDRVARRQSNGRADQVRGIKGAAPPAWFVLAAVVCAGATVVVWTDDRFSAFRLYLTAYFFVLLVAAAVAAVVRYRTK